MVLCIFHILRGYIVTVALGDDIHPILRPKLTTSFLFNRSGAPRCHNDLSAPVKSGIRTNKYGKMIYAICGMRHTHPLWGTLHIEHLSATSVLSKKRGRSIAAMSQVPATIIIPRCTLKPSKRRRYHTYSDTYRASRKLRERGECGDRLHCIFLQTVGASGIGGGNSEGGFQVAGGFW